ncbi:hypothetical protein J1614_005071 [Plenodomus biglobosus]|nr:hypothetical protein J1614_005071 [Plenodomus biglobosus]
MYMSTRGADNYQPAWSDAMDVAASDEVSDLEHPGTIWMQTRGHVMRMVVGTYVADRRRYCARSPTAARRVDGNVYSIEIQRVNSLGGL